MHSKKEQLFAKVITFSKRKKKNVITAEKPRVSRFCLTNDNNYFKFIIFSLKRIIICTQSRKLFYYTFLVLCKIVLIYNKRYWIRDIRRTVILGFIFFSEKKPKTKIQSKVLKIRVMKFNNNSNKINVLWIFSMTPEFFLFIMKRVIDKLIKNMENIQNKF